MEMLIQLWKPEFILDGMNSGSISSTSSSLVVQAEQLVGFVSGR